MKTSLDIPVILFSLNRGKFFSPDKKKYSWIKHSKIYFIYGHAGLKFFILNLYWTFRKPLKIKLHLGEAVSPTFRIQSSTIAE